MKSFLNFTLIILVAVIVSSCYFYVSDEVEIAVTGLTVNTPAITLNVGETATIDYTVEPYDATNRIVRFSSSNNKVATVDENGLVTGIAPGSTTIILRTDDGNYTDTCVVTVVGGSSTDGKHKYVEMGDGLKWATMNLGATKPEEYGDYFAWGEIKPYYKEGHANDNPCSEWYSGKSAGYNWGSYSFVNGSSNALTKYCNDSNLGYKGYTDKLTRLQPADDAATQNWRGSWRIPTAQEWAVLRNKDNFDWTWTNNYEGSGVKGMIVTSKVNGYKGNSIFLPAAGIRVFKNKSMVGIRGQYWSSDLNEENPQQGKDSYISSSTYNSGSGDRPGGFSIRPVCP